MEFKKLTALLLSLSLMSGSILNLPAYSISDETTPPVKEKVKQKAKKQKTKKQEVNKTDYINLNFWNNYNDPNLKYFILRAVESNYDLKMAAKNTEVYYQNIKIQRANQLPMAGGAFSPAYYKMINTTDSDWGFNLPLYVNYEADIFLKNRDKTLLSKKDYEMSLLDEKAAYISVASTTGGTYFNILKLNKMIELQKEIVDLRKEIYELMVLSNEEGITSYQDVIRADKSYIQGNTELINLEKQKIKLINSLAVLIGESPNDIKDYKFSDIENVEYKGEIPLNISSDKITSRPDYKKAETKVERAGVDVRVAKKEFLPSINIGGLALFNASDFSSLLTTKNALLGLGGALGADLFTGGRKIANLKVKKALYEKTLQNYEKTNLTAIQEVNDSIVSIKHDKLKYSENKKQNKLEEKDYSLRELRFNEGVISRLELIQSKENLLVVKKLVLSDKADCFIDYIGLYKALGADI